MENGVADVGVKFAPVAGGGNFAGGGVSVFDEREFAVVFWFFYYPGGAGWYFAVAKCGLKGIEIAFEVTSLFAENNEARARYGGHHSSAEKCSGALPVVEKNIESVVGGETAALGADIGGDGFRSAEKGHGLVEQMGREIEEDAAAGTRLLSPGAGLGSGTETIVSRFETNDAPESACRDGLAEGLEIGVEAAVVVDGKYAVLLLGQLEEFDSFGDGGREWLINYDVVAGFEAALGEWVMRLVGSGNGDELDGIDGEKFVEGADDARVGVELRGRIAGSLQDGGEAQAFYGANDGSMEAATA